MPIRLALVGLGKIARDHHLPALAASEAFSVVGAASHAGTIEGIPVFPTLASLLASGVGCDAVAFCTPVAGRRPEVEAALGAGKHVLLEKPPIAALTEAARLTAVARASGVTIFAAWHSRFALAVAPARALLADAVIRAVRIEWREDVRVWHPGQDWIWDAGGFGVFDPGINALSIATAVLPRPFFLVAAALDVPAGRSMPIAAQLRFDDSDRVPIEAVFDFRHEEPRIWTVAVETTQGEIVLSDGGARLVADGAVVAADPAIDPAGISPGEYPGLYRRFADLVARGESELDTLPLQHAADAFTIGRRRVVAGFDGRAA